MGSIAPCLANPGRRSGALRREEPEQLIGQNSLLKLWQDLRVSGSCSEHRHVMPAVTASSFFARWLSPASAHLRGELRDERDAGHLQRDAENPPILHTSAISSSARITGRISTAAIRTGSTVATLTSSARSVALRSMTAYSAHDANARHLEHVGYAHCRLNTSFTLADRI